MSDGIHFIQDFALILLAATLGGWIARRLGMSPMVGYLFAGLFVGAQQLSFPSIVEEANVRVLAHIGLIFLMFSIGLGIRVRDLRDLGLGPILATLMTALFMLTMGRFFGGLVGLSNVQSLFFAAMLMVSSSVVLGNALTESGLLHQRPGRLAFNQTLLEDLVAIIMLTLLGSIAAYGQVDAGGWSAVLAGLGQLGAFIVLFVITGLVVLPRVVRSIAREASGELQVVFVSGMLFALALFTVLAGYSLALGAFLCGVLVSGIPRSRNVERSFFGMRDVFTAVFFVAVGVSVDFSFGSPTASLILLGTALALVGRFVAASIAWMVVCEEETSALRAGLFLMPVGEFSLIIVGLGVVSGVLPEEFLAAAVGIALVTGAISPIAMRYSNGIANRLSPRRFAIFRNALEIYREFWHSLGKRGGSHLLWRLMGGRLWQIIREVVWITALLLFARPLYTFLQRELSENLMEWAWVEPLLPWYWLLILILVLAPVIALLRNLDALCMILAEYLGMQSRALQTHRAANLGMLRLLVYTVIAIWLLNLMPWAIIDFWIVLGVAGMAGAVMILGWRHFIRWHRRFELELYDVFEMAPGKGLAGAGSNNWEAARREWGLQLEETRLPDHFAGAGRTIADLGLRQRTGATIVGVERQGWELGQPGPHTHLFPGDQVFLLGSNEQIGAALAIFAEEPEEMPEDNRLRRAILEPVVVPRGSPLHGHSLAELNWPRLYAVQVAGARRNGDEIANPSGNWSIEEGDELLLMGAESALRTIRRVLNPPEKRAEIAPKASPQSDA